MEKRGGEIKLENKPEKKMSLSLALRVVITMPNSKNCGIWKISLALFSNIQRHFSDPYDK